jgi:hypothetical protein
VTYPPRSEAASACALFPGPIRRVGLVVTSSSPPGPFPAAQHRTCLTSVMMLTLMMVMMRRRRRS